MKKEELATLIRTIVQEEVEKSLSEVMVEILYSKARKDVIAEKRARSLDENPLQTDKTSPVVFMEDRPPVAQVRPQKKFSTNPVLNKILNETVGGIPGEQEMAPMESVLDTIKIVTPQQLTENTAIAAVANALTRDYRSTMKVIDSRVSRISPPKDYFK